MNKSNPYYLAKVLAMVIAVIFYLLALISRIGTQDFPSILPLLISLVIIGLPLELSIRFKIPFAVAQLGVLLFFYVSGWLSILFRTELTFLIYFAFGTSIYLFIVRKISLLHLKRVWHCNKCFIICISLALVEHVWLQAYLGPMAPESYFVGQDFVHIDTLFHVTITSLLKTYQVASVGLFGLEPITYHLGSHSIFASLAQLCNVSTLEFYNIGFPVIFVPLFCQGMLQAAFPNQKRLSKTESFIGLFVIFFVLINLVDEPTGTAYLVATTLNSHFISESYCVSLILTFLAISVYHQPLAKGTKINQNNNTHILLSAMIPIWLWLIASTKISTGAIVFCLFTYLVLRNRLFRDKFILTASILNCLVLYQAISSTVGVNESSSTIQLGSFYREYVKGYLPIYLFLQYWPFLVFLSAVLILFRDKIVLAIRQKRTIKITIEIILVSIFCGVLPGLLIHIDGGSALYFSDVQFWLSSIAILSLTPYLARAIENLKMRKQKVYSISKKVVLVCIVLVACKSLFFYLRNQVQIRNSLVFGRDYKQNEFAKSLSATALTHMVIDQLSNSGDYQKNTQSLKLGVLKSLRNLPIGIKSKSIIYCENLAEFENVLTCGESTFFVTALTEMALINGLYWKDCFPTLSYGLDSYQKYPKEIKKEEAIAFAKARRFHNIIFLDLRKNSYSIDRVNEP